MKRSLLLLCAVTALCMLCACGTAQAPAGTPAAQQTPAAAETPSAAPEGTPEPVQTLEPTEASAEPTPAATLEPEVSDRLEAFQNALMTLLAEGKDPSGAEVIYDGFTDFGENSFAVCDVDGDGEQELIIVITAAPMSGMVETVYAYDAQTDSLREEYSSFPGGEFYDNGVIKTGWSHNQGYAGDALWPYTVDRYDAASDSYVRIASVDAWDKAISAADYPTDADTDNSGVVYIIVEGNVLEGESDGAVYKNSTDYAAWYEDIFGGASVMEIEYLTLNEDNVMSLG